MLSAMLRIAEDDLRAKEEQTSLLEQIVANDEQLLADKAARIAELEAQVKQMAIESERFKGLFDAYLTKAEAQAAGARRSFPTTAALAVDYSADESRQARHCLSRALKAENGKCFALSAPSDSELTAIVSGLQRESVHEVCDLIESTDGFETMDELQTHLFDASKRNEMFVLALDLSTYSEIDFAPMTMLLLQGDAGGRYIFPAFATVCIENAAKFRPARAPFLELLWVAPEVRRLGIGTLMLREVCSRLPNVKQVRSCLQEARPFWDAVTSGGMGFELARVSDGSRAEPAKEPFYMNESVLEELARLREAEAVRGRSSSEGDDCSSMHGSE